MARLDQLASAKTVAQIASAIGREFAFDLLEATAPSPPQEVRAAVDRLREAGLLSRREFSAIETYSFKHALVQETAYASMLRSERQPLHLRIAEALSTKFIDVAEGAPEVVAYHYTQAREITPAINHWLKAGRQASKRSAFMEAVTHFETALKLLEELPRTRRGSNWNCSYNSPSQTLLSRPRVSARRRPSWPSTGPWTCARSSAVGRRFSRY